MRVLARIIYALLALVPNIDPSHADVNVLSGKLDLFLSVSTGINEAVSNFRFNGVFANGLNAMDLEQYLRTAFSFPVSIVYVGLEDGTHMGYWSDTTGVYREPGNGGYSINNTDMEKHLHSCVNKTTGEDIDCIVTSGEKYIQCTNAAGDVNGLCEEIECLHQGKDNETKWCSDYEIKDYEIKEASSEQHLGFVPVSYFCLDLHGQFTQEVGKVIPNRQDEPSKNCTFGDGSLVQRTNSKKYAYAACGTNKSCNLVYAGGKETGNYDHRYRPWYTITKKLQESNWSPPYLYVDSTAYSRPTFALSFITPIYSYNDTTNRKIFAGVVAVDYELFHVSQFLRDLYNSTSSAAVVYEEEWPNRLIGISTNREISHKVSGKNSSVCQVFIYDPEGDCATVRISVQDLREKRHDMDEVLFESYKLHNASGYPDETLSIKATDALESRVYISETGLYEHKFSGIKWRFLITMPGIECAPGSYNEANECKLCSKGTYQDKFQQKECIGCKVGTYAAREGQSRCTPCPHRLSTTETGQQTCSVCSENFYLAQVGSDKNIFEGPDKYCWECPEHATCDIGTTLATFGIEKGYWRDSIKTSVLYKCVHENLCLGINASATNVSTGQYCRPDHIGPLCMGCEKGSHSHYFDDYKGECRKCQPLYIKPTIFLCTLVAIAVIGASTLRAIKSFPTFGECTSKSFKMIVAENKILMDNLSLQAKLKIIVSYFQVMLVLSKVYGVKLHESFYGIMDVIGLFNFSFLLVPDTASCTSSVSNKLIFIALWPFALIAAFIGIVLFYGITSKGKDRLRSSREYHHTFSQNMQETNHTRNDSNWRSNDSHRSTKYDQSPSASRIRSILGRSSYFIICYIYLILPTIINKIFDAKRCNAFTTDDTNKEQNSYLVVDSNVKCESGDFEYVKLQVNFWILFTLWSILVPLFFIYMLRVCRKQLSLNRASPLADACSFLWRDYDNSMYYWDIVDSYRKLFLTCFVIFIDTEEGSTKIFRLMIGAIVSFTYLAIVAVNDPYERKDDYFLACGSNLLLSISFVLGLMAHICNDGVNDTCNGGGCICQSMILSSLNHEKSSFYFVMMNLGVLVLFFVIIAVRVHATIKAPTIKLVRSGTKPNLQMEKGCEYHAFISHVWATGQNKTHTLVRQIQRLLPSMNIWLDVDSMETVGDLEDSVMKSSTFILFLSQGYFKSQNCKRELRAAFELNKPLIVVYESDRGATLAGYEDEFNEYFENEDKAIMHNYVFNNKGRPAAMWLDETNFQIETIKMVVHRILLHLPYYRRNKKILDCGLKVTNEIGPQGIYEQLVVFSCTSNKGCQVVYNEIQNELAEGDNLISNVDFEEFLERINELPLHRVVLLFYLNKDAFDDEKSGKEMRTSVLLKKATDFGIQLVLMHEQDPEKGACPFNDFFQLTPSDLLDKPYNIYNTLAIPLHASLEHRRVSLRCILRSMGSSTAKNQVALSKLASSGKSFMMGNSSRELKGVWKDLQRHDDEVTAKHVNIRMED